MRRSARLPISLLAALALAAGAAACDGIASGSRIGSVTGRVLGVDQQPSSGAVVYLTALDAGNGVGSGNVTAQDVSQETPVTNGGNGGLTFVSAGGDFQITAAAGDYNLVASDSSPAAAYVFHLHVSGGSVVDVGVVQLAPCVGSSTNPCPAPYGGPSPTPQPPSQIDVFSPDQTNVQHVYFSSGAEDVDVHAVGPIQGADGSPQTGTLDAIFQNPADPSWVSGTTYDLATVGTNLLVQLQVSDSYNVPALYRAISGSLTLSQWQPAPGGTVTVSLASVQLQSVDPSGGSTPSTPVEILSTPPISGVVTAVNEP